MVSSKSTRPASPCQADLDPNEPRDDPDLSIMRDFRLVAQLWRRDGGTLRRAGQRGTEAICSVPFADIVTFDATQEAVFVTLVERSSDEETLIFELELEGFCVTPGVAAPHMTLRRF